jgi:asparagine synthase (glutamine-hydrolysing)
MRGRHSDISDYSAINPQRARSLQEAASSAGLDFSYRPRRNAYATRLWALSRSDPGNYNKGYLGGWGVEVRDPTADRRLVELCLRIPGEEFLAGGRARGLARKALADRLPHALLSEQNVGYQAADWHKGVSGARAEAAFELDRIVASATASQAVDVEMMRRLLRDWPAEGWNSSRNQGLYRLALMRGITGGHFIRKMERSNA